MLAIVEVAGDPVLGVVSPALAQGKRVVAFAERDDAVQAAAACGCEVARDLAGALYSLVRAPT